MCWAAKYMQQAAAIKQSNLIYSPSLDLSCVTAINKIDELYEMYAWM